MAFGEINHNVTNFDYPSNCTRCRCKKPRGDNIFVDFAIAFDSIHRGKMEQILLAYSLSKTTFVAIMTLYRNTEVKVHSPDGDTDYFDIVADVLQGDTLAPYLFILCLHYVHRNSIDKMKDNGFKLTKERSRRYPTQTITDTNFWQIHPPKPKSCYIVWNEQLHA